jgi:hypothetical protein
VLSSIRRPRPAAGIRPRLTRPRLRRVGTWRGFARASSLGSGYRMVTTRHRCPLHGRQRAAPPLSTRSTCRFLDDTRAPAIRMYEAQQSGCFLVPNCGVLEESIRFAAASCAARGRCGGRSEEDAETGVHRVTSNLEL